MLDALKFAFEIFIVGALALPWLSVLGQLISTRSTASHPSFVFIVPTESQAAVTVLIVIAIGYVAGSIVSRASRDLFNDEILGPLATEDSIRDAVYQDAYCVQELMNINENLPNPGESTLMDEYLPLFEDRGQFREPKGSSKLDEHLPLFDDPDGSRSRKEAALRTKQTGLHEKYRTAFCSRGNMDQPPATMLSQHIRNMFLLQESEILLLGQDKVDRLKQYYDQITVLRGAAFNGCMLSVVCLFGCCGNWKVRLEKVHWLKWFAFLPPGFLLLWGIHSLTGHFTKVTSHEPGLGVTHNLFRWKLFVPATFYYDPPMAETVLILLGGLGLFVVGRAAQTATAYLRTCVVAALVTSICYGSWWWTEVMYDDQLVHSQIEFLHPAPAPIAVTAATPLSKGASGGEEKATAATEQSE